jgi:copper chaperone CopZ
VSEALLTLPGVQAVDVTLGDGAPSTVHIDADGELDTDRVQTALDARGSFQVQR